ncbi:MAG: hypothetical protein HS108_10745 [Planctomycetes bacterium]|jgi:hypothetical protein|nr:hypothetical protein [Planctomycetota bacterium]MCL4728814.1 hypothetical protein [Planctomycetota bacterium]
MRWMLLVFFFVAAPLAAGTVEVGKPAPKFKATGRIVNPYEFARTLDDCRGDVIVVFEWNLGDLDMRKVAKQLASTWNTWGGKGLWVFGIHRLRDTQRQVYHYCKAEGISYCVPMGGFYDDETNDFGAYVHEDKIYRTTVIGVDGNVAYYGRGDYDTVLQRELKKLVYPGLGRHQVSEKLAKAARSFGVRDYGAALAEAEKLAAGELTDAEREDAQWIIERCKSLADRRNERIKGWTEDKRFDLVLPALDAMEKEFRGHELGKQAKAAADAIRKDRANKEELKAFDDLKRLIEKSEPQGDQTLINALKTWAGTKRDVRAGKVATDLARRIEEEARSQQ